MVVERDTDVALSSELEEGTLNWINHQCMWGHLKTTTAKIPIEGDFQRFIMSVHQP